MTSKCTAEMKSTMASIIADVQKQQMVELRSGDNVIVMVDKAAAAMSPVLQDRMHELCSSGKCETPIAVDDVPKLTAPLLSMIFTWCSHYAADQSSISSAVDHRPGTVPAWDEDFLNGDLETLADIMVAANDLGIRPLKEIASWLVARIHAATEGGYWD